MLYRRSLAFAMTLAVSTTPAGAQDGSIPVDSVYGRISFSLGERVADTTRPPLFSISFQTQGDYGCVTPLIATLRRADHSVTLSDWRIRTSPLCVDQVAPASGTMTLPLTVGTNQLVIRHRGVEDRYTVAIDRELIRVRAVMPARVSTTADTLIRRIIPGSFALRCAGAAWYCARAYRELALVPGLRSFVVPNEGRNPFGIRYDAMNPPDGEPVRYFLATSNAATAGAFAALQRVRDETAEAQTGWPLTIVRWMGASWAPSVADQPRPR
jgi:hypothetical protein